MRAGELARRAGTTIRALRYYESLGLVVPRRHSNGYRDYGPEAVRMVRRIRELSALGLPVEETRPFLDCLTDGQPDGQTDGQADGQTDGQADGQTDGQADGQTDGQTDGQADGQSDEQTDGLPGERPGEHPDGRLSVAALDTYRKAIAGLDDRIARMTAQRDALRERLRLAERFAPGGRLKLAATDGSTVDLGAAGSGVVVVFGLPRAEAGAFRPGELLACGVSRVYGLTTQTSHEQRRAAPGLSFLADPKLIVARALGVPTFTDDDGSPARLYRRHTLIFRDGAVAHEHATDPERHVTDVLALLRTPTEPTRSGT